MEGEMLGIATYSAASAYGAHMSVGVRPLSYSLGWLIAGTKGGKTRAKIIRSLKETPQNANQLAKQLRMDYTTIRRQIKVLEKNKILTSAGGGYGTTYFLSPVMEDNYVLFEEVVKKTLKSEKKSREDELTNE